MSGFWNDLQAGARIIGRNPRFALFVILTLGIGIGSNVLIFSVVDTALYRPMPFKAADRLVIIQVIPPGYPAPLAVQEIGAAPTWRELEDIFEFVEFAGSAPMTLTGQDWALGLRATLTTPGLLGKLGITPTLGRLFNDQDAVEEGVSPVLLSHQLWKNRFGGSQTILGKSIILDEGSYHVVGVLPEGVHFPPYASTDVWIPVSPSATDLNAEQRQGFMLARLSDGITLKAAQDRLDVVGVQLNKEKPTLFGWTSHLTPLHGMFVQSRIRRTLLILWAVAACLMLVTCANIAGLMLSRLEARRHEMAVRGALGASASRLIRQLFAENMFISILGAAVGLMLGWWGVRVFMAMLPFDFSFRNYNSVDFDLRVWGWTFGLTVIACALFSAIPAWKLRGAGIRGGLNVGSNHHGASSGQNRAQTFFIFAQVALTLVLLTGAGLLVKSGLRHQSVALGFDPANLVTAKISLNRVRYKEKFQMVNFFEQIIEQAAALPGVKAATLASGVPPAPRGGGSYVTITFKESGGVHEIEQRERVYFLTVAHGYLRTMGIPLLRGRPFDSGDGPDSPLKRIVSESYAKRFFPGLDPIGIELKVGPDSWATVVGVAKDTPFLRGDGVTGTDWVTGYGKFIVYRPMRQRAARNMKLVLRSGTDLTILSEQIRVAVAAVDSGQPVGEIQTLNQTIRGVLANQRFFTFLLVVAAAISLLLSAVGVYALVSYSVRRRYHELGIRCALGASPAHISWLVIRRALLATLAGIGFGLWGAISLTDGLSAYLYDVEPFDLIVFTLASICLLGVAISACIIPARKAAKLDPLEVLRYE